MAAKPRARRCAGCGRDRGDAIIAYQGAYWHTRCFKLASGRERADAARKMREAQEKAAGRALAAEATR